ncbi:MAG: hypothetical protein ACE5H0_07175 [Bacteroidota bacterium]
MSLSEFIRVFFREGLSQPVVPPEIGFLDYPVWGILFLAGLGLLTQQTTEPRTTKQKRIRFILFAAFMFAIIWGLVRAFFYTIEVI